MPHGEGMEKRKAQGHTTDLTYGSKHIQEQGGNLKLHSTLEI